MDKLLYDTIVQTGNLVSPRSSVWTRAALYALSIFGCITYAYAGPVRFAESMDLRLKFSFENTNWCGPNVNVLVEGKLPIVGSDSYEAYQQTIGRIRGIITHDCPRTTRIIFDGGKSSSRSDEVSRAGRWRIVQLSSRTKEPECPVESASERDCDPKIRAYIRARDLLNQEHLSDAEMVSFLEFRSPGQVQYRFGHKAGGQIRAIPVVESGLSNANPELLGGIVRDQLLKKCRSSSGKSEQIIDNAESKDTYIYGEKCTRDGQTDINYAIIEFGWGYFYIYTIEGQGSEEKYIKAAGRLLLSGIMKVHQ